jgi:hypothetical protein
MTGKQSCSLVSIERELELAAMNAKRNKLLRNTPRNLDTKGGKAQAEHVHIQKDSNMDARVSAPQICSILKSSKNYRTHVSTVPTYLESENDFDDHIGSPVEQQAANFIDELFGEWSQSIKAAMKFDNFSLSKVMSSQNKSNATRRPLKHRH